MAFPPHVNCVFELPGLRGVEDPRRRTGLGCEDNTASYFDAEARKGVAGEFLAISHLLHDIYHARSLNYADPRGQCEMTQRPYLNLKLELKGMTTSEEGHAMPCPYACEVRIARARFCMPLGFFDVHLYKRLRGSMSTRTAVCGVSFESQYERAP